MGMNSRKIKNRAHELAEDEAIQAKLQWKDKRYEDDK